MARRYRVAANCDTPTGMARRYRVAVNCNTRRYRVAANCDTRRYREAVMVAPGHARQKKGRPPHYDRPPHTTTRCRSP